jgi:hypothetical protein
MVNQTEIILTLFGSLFSLQNTFSNQIGGANEIMNPVRSIQGDKIAIKKFQLNWIKITFFFE